MSAETSELLDRVESLAAANSALRSERDAAVSRAHQSAKAYSELSRFHQNATSVLRVLGFAMYYNPRQLAWILERYSVDRFDYEERMAFLAWQEEYGQWMEAKP